MSYGRGSGGRGPRSTDHLLGPTHTSGGGGGKKGCPLALLILLPLLPVLVVLALLGSRTRDGAA